LTTEVVLALGSNLGDRAATIRSAIAAIAELPTFSIERVSDLYESAALTQSGISRTEPRYLNLVAVGRCVQNAHELLSQLQEIELQHGRTRSSRWAARTLDIDIIKYGELSIAGDELTVPHPEAGKRAFVVVPWLAIQPDAELPGIGKLSCLRDSYSADLSLYQEL
jgi:2-amino-4-hydroxy-6-hydroxymethyldihydropteridine diphosphokinase/dihydroneopterin aldolase/2-amino-4-hydroxy-6-hydroxymethyldihydropteridine diphosphokinase